MDGLNVCPDEEGLENRDERGWEQRKNQEPSGACYDSKSDK